MKSYVIRKNEVKKKKRIQCLWWVYENAATTMVKIKKKILQPKIDRVFGLQSKSNLLFMIHHV